MRMHVYCLEGACIAANCNGIRRWIAQVGLRARSKMWEFEVLMRDERCFCGIFKQKAGWLVTMRYHISSSGFCGTARSSIIPRSQSEAMGTHRHAELRAETLKERD